MNIEVNAARLRVSGLARIEEDRMEELLRRICAVLPPQTRVIEFDLSKVRKLDSGGVGVLMAVYNALSRTGAEFVWRVVNPAPAVRQLLELVRLHRLFEISPPRGPRPE